MTMQLCEDPAYVRATVRSTIFVTIFAVFLLASYAQFGAIVPLLSGVTLAIVLLVVMRWFVVRVFAAIGAAPTAARTKSRKRFGAGRSLLLFALVKYPLVALVLWGVTRFWEMREVIIFTVGFSLLHLVIGLRGLGRFLVEQSAVPAKR